MSTDVLAATPGLSAMLGYAHVVAAPDEGTGRLTDAQRALRTRGIGASDASAIVAPTRYRGPFDVYLAKRGLVPASYEETGPQRWGHLLEAPIAEEYVAQLQQRGEEAWARPVGTCQHPAAAWALATPDRVIETRDDAWLLEVKTASAFLASEWGEPGTDEIPAHYLVQAHWQLLVTGLERCDVAVLLGGQDFRRYMVRADRALHRDLLDQVGTWYTRHIVNGIEPTVQGEGAHAYLAATYPKVQRELVLDADARAAALLERLVAVKAEAKALEAEEKDLAAQLKQAIGDAKGIKAPAGRATWSDVAGRATVDWEAIARAAGAGPELIRMHTSLGGGYRMFRVTPAKGA